VTVVRSHFFEGSFASCRNDRGKLQDFDGLAREALLLAATIQEDFKGSFREISTRTFDLVSSREAALLAAMVFFKGS
jgi:hypothetical protein